MITKEERKVIEQRIKQIEEKNGGRLTPDDVVADARKKDSPLHNLACWKGWDLKRAAHEYWVDQARELISSVRVIVTTEHTIISAPCYVRDPSADSNEQGYVRITSVSTDQDRAREVLIVEFQRVAAMLRRAREVATVLGMSGDVEKLVVGVVGLRDLVLRQESRESMQ